MVPAPLAPLQAAASDDSPTAPLDWSEQMHRNWDDRALALQAAGVLTPDAYRQAFLEALEADVVRRSQPRAPESTAPLQERPSRQGPDEPSREARGRGSLLVVEDDDVIREALVSLLRQQGYQVQSAPQGLAALALLDAGLSPALILLDMSMPALDGPGFLAELRRRGGRFSQLTVLAVSASELPPGTLPVRALLRKPYAVSELLSTVDALVGA